MAVHLAFGLSAGPGVCCWLPPSGGRVVPELASERTGAHPPGAPVAIGPADAGPELVRQAVQQLVLLVRDGTEVAAGAGVDLGNGFTSARLAGAHGDRRDAVLAALKVRTQGLGDRAGTLVALFGPSATKRVGAAASAAIAEERWAALQLASAASDLLGPEQLEQVLALSAPDGVDPFPRGAASTLSEHLSLVLARYPRPRRLALILSLWHDVCARLVHRQRVDRRAATQVRPDRIDKLRERHREHFNAPLLQQLHWATGDQPALADVARWQPPPQWTARELTWLLRDAIAATALLRFAKTMSDEGIAAAARKHRDELVAADNCLTEAERTTATRRPEGAYPHPARPGRYVHDLIKPLRPDRTITAKTEAYVQERVAMARNYGVVVLDAVQELTGRLTERPLHNCWDTCKPWRSRDLRKWRAVVGFTRAPESWEQPPLADAHPDGPTAPLAERLAGTDAVEAEAPHDLLWLADLADALAPFYGSESATVRHERLSPDLDYRTPSPARPEARALSLAAAGVAQLVAFGANPPPRCRTWTELAEAVSADAAVTEASVGAFPIPPEMSSVDKQVVPGTELVVELGREPRQLATWSGYMGNCIGESWYADQARRGYCVLMALRDPDSGRIVANLDVRRHTGGWQVYELRARFNDNLDPALESRINRWVGDFPGPVPPAPEPVLPIPPPRSRRESRPATGRMPSPALIAAVERELASARAVAARQLYAELARGLGTPTRPADFEPDAAVIALNRLGPAQIAELLQTTLDTGLGSTRHAEPQRTNTVSSARHADLRRIALNPGVGSARQTDLGLTTVALWRATRVRPLTTAVNRLGLTGLDALTIAEPLPRALRALVRHPAIAPAHAMDVAARAIRLAMGEPALAGALTRSVARRPSPELVCTLVVATTCKSTVDDTVRLTAPGTTAVPGFPATDLLDEHGPWQLALTPAADLGAPVDLFGRRIDEHGLLVPATLLGSGGWPALWSRAHR
ncbi:hypothetical protein [Amycolatopsis sp. 195334CR]|uniref:hypothetical protein n=1 Tax=Amycolatopsis sp. 195334CR TaxID=2814588 RepID=UPI001A8D3197|nr:hypothetical protein [Amycolatopsis sp. 195334CR]MBN6039973.1 hypothetical protein [Amycolatopsis sp. 195334CR]